MPLLSPSRRYHSLFLALLTVAVGLLALLPAAAVASAPAASQFPYCSWWLTTTPETANVAFPDAAATYWTTPFLASDGLSIEVDGTYPDARYMSFNVYDDAFGSFTSNGVSSGMADYLIAPSSGAINPFQVSGSSGGAFALTLSGDPQPGEPNTLPLAPSGEAAGKLGAPIGYLVYRTYLPTGGNGTVELPTLTLVEGGRRVTLSRCPAATGKLAARAKSPKSVREAAQALAKRLDVTPTAAVSAALKGIGRKLQGGSSGTAPCRGSACPPPLRFFRAKASTTNAFFPNVDNAYVSALFHPLAGTVIVVRGKGATTPPGSTPVPWPQASLQLRYWSLCNNVYRKPWPVVANPQPGGGVTYGCAADDATTLDADGNYAFVVAPERQRAAVEAAGGTFVPLSATQPKARQLLILRNMLPNEGFADSIQSAPQNGNPTSTAAAMGAFYPRAYRCTLPQFKAGSPPCG
ncbi:MAG: hypothetical protein JJE35_11340 [Thermoleophilia bacterium]|nr:hypothetical protein [Thermoleophilia bacterium]